MKRIITVLFLIIMVVPVFANQPAEGGGIAESLFHHITDSTYYSPFPFVPSFLLPFGATVHLLMLFIAAIVILSLFIPAFRKPHLKPRGITLALEVVVLFVRDDIVYPVMGKKGEKNGCLFFPPFSSLYLWSITWD